MKSIGKQVSRLSGLHAVALGLAVVLLGNASALRADAAGDSAVPGRADPAGAPPVRFLAAPVDTSRFLFRLVASGLTEPLYVTNAGDDSGRLFIVQKGGRIRIVKNGALLGTDFLNLSSGFNLATNGEQGLLALAFHPDYASNGKFYVVYTRDPDGAGAGTDFKVRLAQFVVSANPDVADSTSGTLILEIAHPTTTNHNGGTIGFGADGYLYWSIGDGAVNAADAQNLNSLLGKVLRLDVDAASPYWPPTNPFIETPVDDVNTRGEIWAYGLRNPYRTGFDRDTGDLYIGDVGDGAWEEIDYQPAGQGGNNYGWPILEGNACHPAPCSNPANYVAPISVYANPPAGAAAIVGGSVYRGLNFPSLLGWYFYGELYSNNMLGLFDNGPGWDTFGPLTTPYGVAAFGEDDNGELYLADLFGGAVYQIRYRERLRTPSDFDGDSTADPAKFVSGTSTVWWLKSSTATWSSAFLGNDVAEYVRRSDFDGDGKTDPAKYVSGVQSLWYFKSSTSTWEGKYMGPGTYSLLPGSDFDGDNQTDPAKYVPAAGAAWYLPSTTGVWTGVYIGADAGPALPGSDYDGDGMTDLSKYVPSSGAIWYLKSGTGTWEGVYIGSDGSPVPGSDFDGDNQTDPAKFLSASNTVWYQESSTGTWKGVYLGSGTLEYVAGCDFDGDGKTDPAAFNDASKTLWYVKSSTGTLEGKYLDVDVTQVVD
jgi:glucose/arabinose dehydrogenase